MKAWNEASPLTKLVGLALIGWIAWSLYAGAQPAPSYTCRDVEVGTGWPVVWHTETRCTPR